MRAAQEEPYVAEDVNTQEGGGLDDERGAQEGGVAIQRPGIYELERNKHVAHIQERLQALLRTKFEM